jgi:hypothetical protein
VLQIAYQLAGRKSAIERDEKVGARRCLDWEMVPAHDVLIHLFWRVDQIGIGVWKENWRDVCGGLEMMC